MFFDLPPAPPAIIRPGEPWEHQVGRDLARAGLPIGVRLAVVQELRRFQDTAGLIERPALADLSRWSGVKLAGLPGMTGLIFKSGPPIAFEWTDAVAQTVSTSSTSTFSTRAIGTATSTRLVVVFVGARGNAGNARTVTGLTIAGNAASLIVASASNPNPTAIFALVVASGTTATVVVTASGTMSRCGIGICALDNYQSDTAADFDSVVATSGTSADRDLDIAAGGIGLWTCCNDQAAMSWTGADEQSDTTPGTAHFHSCATRENPWGATRTGSAAWTGSGNSSMSAASFR